MERDNCCRIDDVCTLRKMDQVAESWLHESSLWLLFYKQRVSPSMFVHVHIDRAESVTI
jgi:hypothetical protein